MQNLTPRQREILKLVTEKGILSVEEIQQALGISQATTYREFQTLVRLGLAAKAPGGIRQIEVPLSHCIQCRKEINFRAAFFIEQVDGKQASACCPHCGLMFLSRRTDISTVLATDFFYGTRLNARQAVYVLGSSVSLCCYPSVLSFSSRVDAQRFALGFGGEVMDFVGAQNKVDKLMAL